MVDLTRIRSRGGAPFTVSGAYAPKFQGLLDDLEAAGYAIDAGQSGGYNPRNIAGTNTPSNHAFGRAIDINWTDNARGTRGKIPEDLAQSLAAKHGLRWGGTFKNRDDMHFEVANGAPVPVGQRSLTGYAGLGGPKEEPAPAPTEQGAPMPQRPMMGAPAQGPGLFESLMNPMTMAGLTILGSRDRDVGRGLQTGMQMQEYQRKRALEDEQRAKFDGLVGGMGAKLGEFGPLVGALGPEKGSTLLAELMQSQRAANKPTDDQREYEMAKQQGFKGGFMDYLTQIKKAGAQVTQIDMKQESAYDKKMGETLAEEFVTANRAAASAQRDLANLDVMKQALADPNLYTGTAGNAIQAVKKGAQSLFGVPVKGVSSGEVMANLASEIAVSNKQKLPGPMSDADRQFLVDMAPNLVKSPEGNRLIIELAMAHKRWEASRGKAARGFATKNGGRLTPDFYAAVGDLDSQAQQDFSTILGRLRSMGEMAPRAPGVGTPLGSGTYNWSPDGGLQGAK